jgi:hypothetical protein
MARLTASMLALVLCLGALAPQPAAALGDNEKKALAAALALGLAVAAAKHAKDQGNNADWDEDLHGKPFRPAAGVVCLPKPRKCYENGHLSWRWTQRVFG